MKIYLDNEWIISSPLIEDIKCKSPCTVLSALLEKGVIEDPYFGTNEEEARRYLECDYSFSSTFELNEEQLHNNNYLFLDGLLTIGEVFINDEKVCDPSDYHLSQKVLLNNKKLRKTNVICIKFKSSYKYIREYPNPGNLFETYAVTDKDSPKIRQPNYMFGWDWGPSLADMGISKPLFIISNKVGFLKTFRHHYVFRENAVDVQITPFVESKEDVDVEITLSGHGFKQKVTTKNEQMVTITIDNPKLWYPNGYGEQPLYELSFVVKGKEDSIEKNYRIGIRKIHIDDSLDKIGRNFALYVNDKKIFIKGSNFVPEDNLLTLINPDRTRRLIELAKSSNHNLIRVWGGGYYPNDDFYGTCDELGILVFQDLMFACASYNIDDLNFQKLVIDETTDVLRRIRHHACIYLIAGNNEIEDGVRGHGHVPAQQYLKMFHVIMKDIVNKETDFYYHSSSPSSGEPYFAMPNDTSYLDVHYWWVWCNDYPLEAYATIQPRLLSEFGLQSYPTYETICNFTKPSERVFGSETMCSHQKMESHSDERIKRYTESLFKTTDDLKKMSYLSMLMQAEGVKICVENLKQHKERCNGAIYWQLNDCWPCQSCSVIDYYFGAKALYYYFKRMYADHLVSFRKDKDIIINVSNDTDSDMKYVLTYSYFDIHGNLAKALTKEISVEKYSSMNAVELKRDENYVGVYASISQNNRLISDNYCFFKKDKDIEYEESHIVVKKINDNELAVTADTFTRAVCINIPNGVVIEDNYFNLLKGQTKIIRCPKNINPDDLEIICLNNLY